MPEAYCRHCGGTIHQVGGKWVHSGGAQDRHPEAPVPMKHSNSKEWRDRHGD